MQMNIIILLIIKLVEVPSCRVLGVGEHSCWTRSQCSQGPGSSRACFDRETFTPELGSQPGLLRERRNAELAFISGRAAVRLSTSTQPLTSREMVEFRRRHISALSNLSEVCQWNKKWTRSTGMEHAEYCRSRQGCSASLVSMLQLVLCLQCFHFQRHLLFYFTSSTC